MNSEPQYKERFLMPTRGHTPTAGLLFLVILVLGLAIALVDGLARPALSEDEALLGALEYEAGPAALLFAGLMLPLCLLYARAAATTRTEGLLLWLILCTTAYTKDFAYVRPLPLPVFVTDLTLAILLVTLTPSGLRWLRPKTTLLRMLCAFLAMGTVAAGRGVISGQDTILVARDFALVVYIGFLFAGVLVVRTWAAVRRCFLFFALGTGISVLAALAWFVAQPGQRRYLAFGVYALAAFAGSITLVAARRLRGPLGWGLVALFGIGLILANARTLYVALILQLAVALWFGGGGQRISRAVRLRAMVGTAVIGTIVLLLVAQTTTGRALVERGSEELLSGTLRYADDPHARFRFAAWLEAFDRFRGAPLWGEGFGIPFTFQFSDADPRPHNTYLTVLYKTGLLGFIPLVIVLGLFNWKGWSTLRRFRARGESSLLFSLLLGHLGMCLFGLLNLLLESPFLASVYWLMVGVGLRMIVLLGRETTPTKLRVAGAR